MPSEWVRQLALPSDLRFGDASAQTENGILTIRIPKRRQRAPEKIRIQVTRTDAGGWTIDASPGKGCTQVDNGS